MIEIKTQSKYMEFSVEQPPKYKTVIVFVYNKGSAFCLGVIRWYNTWRQYCFMPSDNCVFSKGCLEDINKVIEELKTISN